jgi:hypothetical protein
MKSEFPTAITSLDAAGSHLRVSATFLSQSSVRPVAEVVRETPKRAVPGDQRQFPISAASSTGRCNIIQCIDSTMLPRENHRFGCTLSKPSHGSVPAGLTTASNFNLCFQRKVDSSSNVFANYAIAIVTLNSALLSGFQ